MFGKAYGLWRTGLLVLALAAGCSPKPTAAPPAPDEEKGVRDTFTELQAAVKNQDATKIWALLDSRSRADAEKAAKAVQAAHAQATGEEKAKQEKALGLTEAEVAGLTGEAFLKTKRFQKKYRELPESTITKVAIEGDKATVHYLEPDGDKEKLILVRQDGQWRVWLAMPKGT